MAYNTETQTLVDAFAADPFLTGELRRRTGNLRLTEKTWTAELAEMHARRARGPILAADPGFDWGAIDFETLADDWNKL